MVGVAGRSKACHTCKQRRKACGGERPGCARCARSGRSCTGYQMETLFMHSSGAPKTSRKGSQATKAVNDMDREIEPHRSRQQARPPKVYQTWSSQELMSTAQVSPTSTNQQQLLSCFIHSWAPDVNSGPRDALSWINHLPRSIKTSRALDVSIQAICLARLGRLNLDHNLLRVSVDLYTQGLRELQIALWDPKQMHSDETLGACMALANYELMECPNEESSGYISHHDGLARLVQLRGPRKHVDGLAHQIFIIFRIQGIMQALDRECPSFLSEPAWKDVVPREEHDLFDELVEIFAETPEVLAQAGQLKGLESFSLAKGCIAILGRLWELDCKLSQLFKDFDSSTPGPLYTPKFTTRAMESSDHGSNESVLFPVAFHFSNLRMASTTMWYWSLCTMIWSGMSSLYYFLGKTCIEHGLAIDLDPCAETPFTHGTNIPCNCEHCSVFTDEEREQNVQAILDSLKSFPYPEHRIHALATAWNICQSVEYCMQDCMLGAGPSALTGPLNIVFASLKARQPSYQKEIAWVEEARQRIGDRALRYIKTVNR